jgi:pyridoxamine 5'-phosphate oxidase-like protein
MVRTVAGDPAGGDNGPMTSWRDVEDDAPELAEAVRARFAAGKHCTLATLRRDGAPRISGTEVEFTDGEIRLGSMAGARKLADLERDPRVALHSPTTDPPEAAPSDWPGEAKVAGRAIAVAGQAAGGEDGSDGARAFRLELDEVVFTKVEGDQLVVTSWHPGRGVEVHRRA